MFGKCSTSFLRVLRDKSELIPKIATAFGGGFGRKGLVCGCVTGALMVIGLKLGRTDSSQSNAGAYEVTRKFCGTFKERFGSLFCRELIGLDLTTEEGRRIFAEKKVGEEKCVNFVKESALILLDLIEKQDSRKKPFSNDYVFNQLIITGIV